MGKMEPLPSFPIDNTLKSVGMFRESDSEVIAQMLASNSFDKDYDVSQGPQWEKRIAAFMHEVESREEAFGIDHKFSLMEPILLF